tara:strand:- start:708 stop:1826 length:1119 start_codon:yes stop_codon:yes gene_type:complete
VQIKYKINDNEHQIYFCKKNQFHKITECLEKSQSDKNILFVYDDNVNKETIKNIIDELNSFGCNLFVIECKGSKQNKNEKFLFKILDTLIKNKFTKKSIIISFGGGVVGDVTALASSLYLRGLIYFCIPTTMTAIVDSSIGGKTAINYKGVINSIGNYYHPDAVFIMEETIKEIPDREYFAGFAEIIKCGLIGKNKILEFLEKEKKNLINRKIEKVFMICFMTLNTKIKFFSKDIYEKNVRLMLNFGHTFAHAIEMAIENRLKKDFIRHGEAVGIGILCEIYYSNRKKNNLFNNVSKYLKNFNLPINLDNSKIPIKKVRIQNEIYKNLFLDKKKVDKHPRYISLKKKGNPSIKEMKDYDFLNDTILKVIFKN